MHAFDVLASLQHWLHRPPPCRCGATAVAIARARTKRVRLHGVKLNGCAGECLLRQQMRDERI
ncbi:hypothetical protein PL79_002335 [Burkholderia sp. USMB20]|nr:hypothetical protein PL79_002335 [Burkholderia sp. USMB20]